MPLTGHRFPLWKRGPFCNISRAPLALEFRAFLSDYQGHWLILERQRHGGRQVILHSPPPSLNMAPVLQLLLNMEDCFKFREVGGEVLCAVVEKGFPFISLRCTGLLLKNKCKISEVGRNKRHKKKRQCIV